MKFLQLFKRTLASRLYLMLTVAVWPLFIVAGYQVFVGLQASRELERAFESYDLITQAKSQYRVFVEDAALAVDSGRLSPRGITALNATCELLARRRTLTDTAADDTDKQMESVRDTIVEKSDLDTLMRIGVQIHDLNPALDAKAEATQRQFADIVLGSGRRAYSDALVMGIAAATSVAVALLLGVNLIRGLTHRLRAAARVAQNIARGHLDNEIDVGLPDEAGQLMQSMQTMQQALTGVMAEIRTTVAAAHKGISRDTSISRNGRASRMKSARR